MSALPSFARLHADFLALEANTEQAGQALACAYSTSAEYEAALIHARRAAGVYSWPRRRRQLVGMIALSAALIVGTFFLV
jgi:hypothetical protein